MIQIYSKYITPGCRLSTINIKVCRKHSFYPISSSLKTAFYEFNKNKMICGLKPDYDGILAAPISIKTVLNKTYVKVLPFPYSIHALRRSSNLSHKTFCQDAIERLKRVLILEDLIGSEFLNWPMPLGIECLVITNDEYVLITKRSNDHLTSKGVYSNACAGYYEFLSEWDSPPSINRTIQMELESELAINYLAIADYKVLGLISSEISQTIDLVILIKLFLSYRDLRKHISQLKSFDNIEPHTEKNKYTLFELKSIITDNNDNIKINQIGGDDITTTHTLYFALKMLLENHIHKI